ncbi:MAG: Hsp20 family protein [Selenomonadaceae bacterium]|nr:Hsp20 family protein [Selenomonadaceae bacterium]MBQ1511794.1 Hsp20 family protein [Selenomonadaceae bacterium]MBQ1914829.1 Hsp20 family protein [Selenomonadaceae bacterium]MBQ3972373.1 Hsp20 family protein [Selenomonadaceae bacterium]
MFRNIPFNIKGNAEKGREVLEKVMDFALDQPFNPISRVSGALSSFRVDVTESEGRYEVFAELPGFTKEEITVSYDEDCHLSISAERLEVEDDAVKFLCRERRTGKFERAFYIDDIEADEVNVSFENGVLHIILPKAAEGKNKKVFDIA